MSETAFLVNLEDARDVSRVIATDLGEVVRLLQERRNAPPLDFLRVQRLRTLGGQQLPAKSR